MGYCSNYVNGGRSMMRGGMFTMGITWWILIAVVIIAAVYLLKNKSSQPVETSNAPYQNNSQHTAYPYAFEVLDEEYAKGNITEEEYLHKKEVLTK